jgi:hypothetical protein
MEKKKKKFLEKVYDMLPDEMEAEKNRKIILEMSDKIDLIERNVLELQGQLQAAYKRNVELIAELEEKECFCGLAEEPVLATEEY